MEKDPQNTLTSQILELFDTGEEAVAYLHSHGLTGNRCLLTDLDALCSTVASAIEQLMPRITLKNKLKEIGLNAPLTVERIVSLLDEGQADRAQVQFECSLVPLLLFWRRYAEFSGSCGVRRLVARLVCPRTRAYPPGSGSSEAG